MDSNTKILVTGASGFMGSWICKELVSRGYSNIFGVDDLSGGSTDNIYRLIKNKKINFIKHDLSDKSTAEMIKGIKPEIIYYLAANAREGASFFQPLEIVKRNYFAYINTLESAIKTGKLDKVILFSSMAVYGDQKAPFDETIPRRPIDIYAINKAAMEYSTELLSDVHNFDYVILRPHNVMGPFQSMIDKYRNVVMIMCNKIMRKEPIVIYGDGTQTRAFSFILDSTPCYIRALENNKANGEIINIGGKIPITINKLTELVCESMGVDPKTYPINHIPDRFGEVKVAYCTIDKSERLLGYEETYGYEEGIKETAEWARAVGPQEWTEEKLSLWNSKAPAWWG